MKKKSGFTILELAVTVIMIAVIAVVALPMYKHAILKSRFSTVMPMAKAVADAQEIYYLGNNQYALGKEDLDIAPVEAENTQVSLSPAEEDEEYIYVAAHRTDIPNVRYIMYQKNSPKFASNIHCEADANDEDALWLCEKALHGQKIEKGSLTPGYTTYILTGNLSDGTFLKECEEEQVLEDSSCACGKRTRTSTGCDDLTGKWEYSEWSSCPQELPDETETCGEGLVGTKTRTASCNGNSYEYGEWNTDNCAPACKDEDLVLEETCEDGYAKKTRTKTGCGSDGQWEYTEWDESKCCKGAKVLEQACSSGCGKQTRSIEGCENGEWKYGNWSTCPTKPADESVACDSGYTGTKTRSATCKADNSGWEFKGDYNMQTCCNNYNGKPSTTGACNTVKGSSYCGTVYYSVTCTKGTGTYGKWKQTETRNNCTKANTSSQSCPSYYTIPSGTRTVTSATCQSNIWRYSWDYSNCGCSNYRASKKPAVDSSCASGYAWLYPISCSGSSWTWGNKECIPVGKSACDARATLERMGDASFETGSCSCSGKWNSSTQTCTMYDSSSANSLCTCDD